MKATSCPKCNEKNSIRYTMELTDDGVTTNIFRCLNEECLYQPMDLAELFKAKLSAGKALTDEEVQELRDKAKKYRDEGGEYLGAVESK